MHGWMWSAGRRATAPLLALAAAVLVAGCGSSYTKQDYVLRAEGICNSTLRSLRLLDQPDLAGSAAARTASLGVYLGHAVPLMRAEARKLSTLPDPLQTQAQKRTLERYLAALQATVDELGALTSAAREGNVLMVSAAQKSLEGDSTSALAAAYGLKACSDADASSS